MESELKQYSDIDEDFAHKVPSNVLASAQTLIIDDQLLNKIEVMGYPRDFMIRCLNANDLNYALTCYYLLVNK